jgi:DnaJ-class molecular chaperone
MEHFLDRLRAGEVFDVRDGTLELRCAACGGWGRVIVTQGKRSGDGREPCKKCRGTGKVIEERIIRVQW